MKKNSFIYMLMIIMLCPLMVNASMCSYGEQADLNAEVATLKVIYEEKKAKLDPDEYFCSEDEGDCDVEYEYFQISILNMSPKFNVRVKNNVNNKVQTFTYKDSEDGIVSFDFEELTNITTFTFEAISTSETGCANEKYRTFYLTTPRYNQYANYSSCTDNPEFYLCEKYVTFTDVDYYEFEEKIQKYEEEKRQDEIEKNKNFLEKVWDFIKDNKVAFVMGGVVLIALVATTILIVRNKRKKSVL